MDADEFVDFSRVTPWEQLRVCGCLRVVDMVLVKTKRTKRLTHIFLLSLVAALDTRLRAWSTTGVASLAASTPPPPGSSVADIVADIPAASGGGGRPPADAARAVGERRFLPAPPHPPPLHDPPRRRRVRLVWVRPRRHPGPRHLQWAGAGRGGCCDAGVGTGRRGGVRWLPLALPRARRRRPPRGRLGRGPGRRHPGLGHGEAVGGGGAAGSPRARRGRGRSPCRAVRAARPPPPRPPWPPLRMRTKAWGRRLLPRRPGCVTAAAAARAWARPRARPTCSPRPAPPRPPGTAAPPPRWDEGAPWAHWAAPRDPVAGVELDVVWGEGGGGRVRAQSRRGPPPAAAASPPPRFLHPGPRWRGRRWRRIPPNRHAPPSCWRPAGRRGASCRSQRRPPRRSRRRPAARASPCRRPAPRARHPPPPALGPRPRPAGLADAGGGAGGGRGGRRRAHSRARCFPT